MVAVDVNPRLGMCLTILPSFHSLDPNPLTLSLQNRSPQDGLTHHTAMGRGKWFVVIPSGHTKPVGCIIAFVYANKTGWVGIFCLQEEYRGQGWGSALFAAGMEEFRKAGCVYIGLDGVAEQKQTYERRGFVATALVRCMDRVSLAELPLEEVEETLAVGEKLVTIREVEMSKLVASDLIYTGFERPKLWGDGLFNRDDTAGSALLASDGELLAWAVVRKMEVGYRVGPVYANTAARAKRVLREVMLLLELKEESLHCELWLENGDAQGLFESLGWKSAGVDFHRMWVDSRQPEATRPGGKAENGMFAIFDAANG